MAKQWQGKSFDEDFYEIDAFGQRTTGEKNWDASNAFHGGGAPATPQTGGAAPPQTGGNLGSEVDAQLMSQIKPPTGVNTADPAYQQQLNAGQLASHRATERNRMAAAQRMHAQGQSDSGAMDAAQAGIVADQGIQDQGFEAQLMDRFLGAERERAARALQLATGLTGQREGYGLQRELGMADIDLRRQGMSQQNSQFYDQLAQQLGLSTAQLNQQAMNSLLGGF